MNTAKAIKLAKKLKELADKGVGGEAGNAKAKLDALLKKYNLNAEEIFGEEREYVWKLTTINESSSILNRAILSIKPDAKVVTEVNGIVLLVKVSLTQKEYNKIRKKHIFFWNAFNKVRATLLSAFFNKHSHYFIPRVQLKKDFFDAGAVRQPPPKDNPHVEGEVEVMSTAEQRMVGEMMRILPDIRFELSDEEMNDFKMIEKKNEGNEHKR